MNKNCGGCPGYEDEKNKERNISPQCSYFNVNASCPCSNCIIKMICNDDCESFRIRWNIAHNVHQTWDALGTRMSYTPSTPLRRRNVTKNNP